MIDRVVVHAEICPVLILEFRILLRVVQQESKKLGMMQAYKQAKMPDGKNLAKTRTLNSRSTICNI